MPCGPKQVSLRITEQAHQWGGICMFLKNRPPADPLISCVKIHSPSVLQGTTVANYGNTIIRPWFVNKPIQPLGPREYDRHPQGSKKEHYSTGVAEKHGDCNAIYFCTSASHVLFLRGSSTGTSILRGHVLEASSCDQHDCEKSGQDAQ